MGAVMKQTITRDITNGKILTESGYVRDPKEAAEHLKARFETDEWRAAHADKAIHQIVVTYSNHEDITERPPVEHDFESLTGKMDSFSYMGLGRDQIARRGRSCWCDACFRAWGRTSLTVSGKTLLCEGCASPSPLPWYEQSVKRLGTGLAGRRKESQENGHVLAPKLKEYSFFAMQARERWSIEEDALYRPGHFWLAQVLDVLEVRKILKRETINGQPFHPGDYMIRIGRYFDRDASDTTSLTFEEWQPELVFSANDVDSKLTITSSGHVKVDKTPRNEVFWGEVTPPELRAVKIISVDEQWVKYGLGKNDKFRNPRTGGDFIINSTELRAVNFLMEPIDKPPVQPRMSGRRAAVVSAPLPKRYKMPKQIDDEIRKACH